MGILTTLLLVLFIIVSVLLVLLVLIQDEGGDSLGGIFAGSSNSAFGSRTGNVVTRFTGFLGALFMLLAVGLTFLYRSGSSNAGLEKKANEQQTTAAQDQYNWQPGTASPSPSPLASGASPAPSATPAEVSQGGNAVLPSPSGH